MYTKFVLFVAISAFLVAALYSSSVPVAFGAVKCVVVPANTKDTICISKGDKTGKTLGVWYCTGGVPPCIRVYSEPTGDIQDETKVPKSDLLNDDDGGLLTEGSQSDNNTAPKDLGESNNDENGPAVNPGLQ